jgi:hypothetical protein
MVIVIEVLGKCGLLLKLFAVLVNAVRTNLLFHGIEDEPSGMFSQCFKMLSMHSPSSGIKSNGS